MFISYDDNHFPTGTSFCIYNRSIGLTVRVFASGSRDRGSIPGRVIPKTQKILLGAGFLNTQHYKVWIKGKVKQPSERSSVLPQHLGVVAIEKGAFGSPSTKDANFTYLYISLLLQLVLLWTRVLWKLANKR